MKLIINNSTLLNSNPILDCGPDEPSLYALNECSDCYFRLSTIERIQNSIKQLREEADI
jgi:hypothetical protein